MAGKAIGAGVEAPFDGADDHRHVIRIGFPGHPDGDVVAFAGDIDEAAGEVEVDVRQGSRR